ncbi:aldo/keto reductase [Spirochaeta isovalerica]|uniref:D-threo-aldose 1-dehydrogenase n=1 Tax=Spirochaeta isovalerica TaxID=150 RepID=A0A841RBT0_9SPIO|nr:aldo/keto reductase [Spirochaeta isovalerica]MBB6480687.1 D-threo-aldose 1-dehydrogenase [Spirochaeta isovalerica]
MKNKKITLPRLIHGSSSLGNLYQVLPGETKKELVSHWISCSEKPVCIDSAGKYGAGLALEEIGKALRNLSVPPQDVMISNKLGWTRIPLTGDEPTFEPGVWKSLQYDAEQSIGKTGIHDCWKQGNELLGAPYKADLVSVHDPDEYLDGASTEAEKAKRHEDIIQAYQTLSELKKAGEVKAIGIGSKNWKVIRSLAAEIDFDWVMFANSFTIYSHPSELVDLIDELSKEGVAIVNSAVFHSGFLAGSSYFDYREVSREEEPRLYEWRDRFFKICQGYDVKPVDASIEFGLMLPGIDGISLNTTNPERVDQNLASISRSAPAEFWREMKKADLIKIAPEDFL